MSTIRHFGGNRSSNKQSVAREIMRFEMEKKGKMPTEMRYKLIFKRKREEAQAKAAERSNSASAGAMVAKRKMSARAEQALKEVSAKKAAKEAKKMRHMVLIEPQHFSNGLLNKKGKIHDIAGNVVGKVNTKNGKMSTNMGMPIGKYKPKSFTTRLQIEGAIDKYSPYFIRQRQLAALQASMSNVYGSMNNDPNVINVHGISANSAMLGAGVHGNIQAASSLYGNIQQDYGVFGPDDNAPRTGINATMTAWGAMSNSVHGNFSTNVWGTTGDNVWGTASSDVWGSVSGSSMWGKKGVRMYGTGNGVNYLTGLTKWVLGLFGYQSKKAREAMRNKRLISAAVANSASRSGGAPRTSAPAPRRR